MPKLNTALSTARTREAVPLPPRTIERPRGPVRTSLRDSPPTTLATNKTTSASESPAAWQWPKSGMTCRSIFDRSVIQLEFFLSGLKEGPSARYRSQSCATVSGCCSVASAAAFSEGSMPPATKPKSLLRAALSCRTADGLGMCI